MLFDISHAVIEVLNDDLFTQKKLNLSVLRLDKIHPVVSGNKLFKLHYFLKEVSPKKTIITFGGAYSNHLAATAFACSSLNIKSIGIVRGEEPVQLSHTLKQCIDDRMQLRFIPRDAFTKKESAVFIDALKKEYGDPIIIPEGGYHPIGADGAALIMDLAGRNYSHICTAVGTATTLAGLLKAAHLSQTIIGIPVLKGMNDIQERIQWLTGNNSIPKNLELLPDYHFGGYAKKTDALIRFINQCWQQYHLPLDFVYTAKLFFGIIDHIKKGHFPEGSNILCLHTGGLQGNKSLPLHTLLF